MSNDSMENEKDKAEKLNNQSDKAEQRFPQDSKRKEIEHPDDDTEAVVKPEDQAYVGEDADFKKVAQRREESEQPVHPIKTPPKDV